MKVDADGLFAGYCAGCGGGDFCEADQWCYTYCTPSAETPLRTLTIPGGNAPEGNRQDVVATIQRAVEETDVSTDTLYQVLDRAGVEDIRCGRIGEISLRAFADLLEGGWRNGRRNGR